MSVRIKKFPNFTTSARQLRAYEPIRLHRRSVQADRARECGDGEAGEGVACVEGKD